jgi:hypothetical protein
MRSPATSSNNASPSQPAAWKPWAIAALAYLAFLCWHEPWFVRPLTQAEVTAAFDGPLAKAHLHPGERELLHTFFSTDDGRAFYNINLMQYRVQAKYTDGQARAGIVSGRDANAAYSNVVIPLLLERAGYPVFASTKTSSLMMSADAGADFFEELAVVRYRSRRDMLEMILDPRFLVGAPHKMASLEQNIAAPSIPFIVVDARALVAALLLVLTLLWTARAGRLT